jgi:hypothetical protein
MAGPPVATRSQEWLGTEFKTTHVVVFYFFSFFVFGDQIIAL